MNMKKPDLYNTQSQHEVFKVPEGYFEELEKRIMLRVTGTQEADGCSVVRQPAATVKRSGALPGEDRKRVAKLPFWKTELYAKIKPYIYMAAMFGGLYFGVWVYKYQQRLISEKNVATMQKPATENNSATQEETEDYINDACDYMMTDSHDIMACVTDNEQ